MFKHHFIHNDQQNSSPSNNKVRITDKNNKSFTSMSNDHIKSEIARRAMAVVAAYEELGSACRKAEYCVSQLKALLPPDTNVVLPSDTSIPTLPPSLPNKPPQNLNIPISYDINDRNDRNDRNVNANTATSSSNLTTAGFNDDNMVASLLMSLTNASWERSTNTIENDKLVNDLSVVTNSPTSSNTGAVMGSCDGLSLDEDDEIYDQKHDSSSEQDFDETMTDANAIIDDDNDDDIVIDIVNENNDDNDDDDNDQDDDELSDINMIDDSSSNDNKSSINDSNSEKNTRKRSSSSRSRTRRKPSTGRVSSPASPYSTQFTQEEILFLDEFNKLYEKRVQLGPTRQSDIASEIRQFANNAIAFGQPAVSGLVRKTKVPKEQKAVNALKAWIESGKKRLGVV